MEMYLRPQESKKQKKYFFGFLKATEEKSRIRIRNPVDGSKDQDPDPYQMSRIPNTVNITDDSSSSAYLETESWQKQK